MSDNASLAGQFLIAMPNMPDPRFARSVVFLCAHTAEGAMGLVINRLFEPLSFAELMSQLDIEVDDQSRDIRVHFGGPVESGRGFVLHSADYEGDGTMKIGPDVALTATVDILKVLAEGGGPKRCFLALGYAGWAPGQLDAELQANGWLHAPGDADILFDLDVDGKWEKVLGRLGIKPAMLSSEAGRA
jgi:putative transcriptional regulator